MKMIKMSLNKSKIFKGYGICGFYLGDVFVFIRKNYKKLVSNFIIY